jgi:hypothetical protein
MGAGQILVQYLGEETDGCADLYCIPSISCQECGYVPSLKLIRI